MALMTPKDHFSRLLGGTSKPSKIVYLDSYYYSIHLSEKISEPVKREKKKENNLRNKSVAK